MVFKYTLLSELFSLNSSNETCASELCRNFINTSINKGLLFPCRVLYGVIFSFLIATKFRYLGVSGVRRFSFILNLFIFDIHLVVVASSFKNNVLSLLPAEIGALSLLGTLDLHSNQVGRHSIFSLSIKFIRPVSNSSETSDIPSLSDLSYMLFLLILVSFTFTSIMAACMTLAFLNCGQQIHGRIIRRGLDGNLALSNALIDMYSKCGNIADSHQVFGGMSRRDLVSWTTMMIGYETHGYGEEVVELFDKMVRSDIKPD